MPEGVSKTKSKKIIKYCFNFLAVVVCGLVVSWLLPHTALAQFNASDAQQAASQFGISTAAFDLRGLIVKIIKYLLSFLGLIAVIIVMYGGFLWMTARGDEKKVELAKKVLTNGLIGLGIIISAYIIVSLIINIVSGILNPQGQDNNTNCTNCSALGGGIIEYHYPGRGATVARNAHISITFKEGIFVAASGDDPDGRSLIPNAIVNGSGNWSGGDSAAPTIADAPPPIMLLQRIGDDGSGAGQGNKLSAATNSDRRIFSFYNDGLLDAGKYRAIVKGGNNGLSKLSNLGGPAMGGDYEWTFNVSTDIDLTPPHIKDVVPINTTEPRNTTVLITFSEPIDPISVVTHPPGGGSSEQVGDTITIKQTPLSGGAAADVSGIYDITNGYTTVTYRTNSPCGKNVCGATLFCFDAEAKVDVEVKAASLLSMAGCDTGPVNEALRAQKNANLACVNPPTLPGAMFDGIVDMAGNSFDGNNNAASAGPAADNYPFTFDTSSAVATHGPRITATTPVGAAIGVEADETPTATFTRRIYKYTSDDFRIYSLQADGVHQNASMVPRWALQSIEYKCGVSGEFCTPKNMQASVCVGGSFAGSACTKAADCGDGGTCTARGRCIGGTKNGNLCIPGDATDACVASGAGGVCGILSCPASVDAADDKLNSCGRSTVELRHGNNFDQSGNQQYEPRLGPNILDQYQNCFSPTTAVTSLTNTPGETTLKLDTDNP